MNVLLYLCLLSISLLNLIVLTFSNQIHQGKFTEDNIEHSLNFINSVSTEKTDTHDLSPINPKPTFSDKFAICGITIIRFEFYTNDKNYVNIPIMLEKGYTEINKEDRKFYFYWSYSGDEKEFLNGKNVKYLENLLKIHQSKDNIYIYAVGKYQALIAFSFDNAEKFKLFSRHSVIGDSYVIQFDNTEEYNNGYNSFVLKFIIDPTCDKLYKNAYRNIAFELFNVNISDFYEN